MRCSMGHLRHCDHIRCQRLEAVMSHAAEGRPCSLCTPAAQSESRLENSAHGATSRGKLGVSFFRRRIVDNRHHGTLPRVFET